MDANEVADWMVQEHAKITELSDQLRQMVAAPPRGDRGVWVRELQSRFEEYFGRLHRHFEMEEQGGYLTEVLQLRPTLSAAVALVQQEHEELSELFQDVQSAVRELAPTDNLVLRDCCERVKQLLAWIERHEEHENHIVLYAFTQDLAAGD